MYSTSGLTAFGVVGEAAQTMVGSVSNADLNDLSDTAVCGSGMYWSFGLGSCSSDVICGVAPSS